MPAYKVTNVKYKTKHNQLRNEMTLLNVLLRVFSIDSSDKRISKSEKFWFIIRCILSAFIFGILNVYCFCWKIENVFPILSPSIVITDVIQTLYDYIQYIVDLIFVSKYGSEISLVYLKNFDYIDRILDMTHEKKIQGRIMKVTLFLVPFWLIVVVFDFYAWYLAYGILAPTFYMIYYTFILVKILTSLDLTVQIYNVECRLRVIADLLQEYYKKTDSLPTVVNAYNVKDDITDSICNENWFYGKVSEKSEKIKTRIYPIKGPINSLTDSSYKIKLLTRCYLLLGEQCAFINKIFGFRILLNSLSLLIEMVRLLNIAVRIFFGSQKTNEAGYLPGLSSFMKFMICVSMLTSLVYHCERAYEYTERIVNLTNHILINRNPDEATRSSLKELRGLVSSKPVSFNACDFFRLGYPFLVSTISVVATYTIILLQNS